MWSIALSLVSKGFSGIYVYLIIGAICLSLGAWGGIKVTKDYYQAQETKVLEANQAKFEAQVVKNNTQSTIVDQKKDSINANTQAINSLLAQVISRPVYQSSCFDADGLRLSNSALTGQTATTK